MLENAVDPRAIDRYVAELDSLMASPDKRLKMAIGIKREIVPMSRERLKEQDSVRLVDHYVYSENARALLFNRPVVDFLATLFEEQPQLFQSLGFHFGSQQGIHQDTAYVVADKPMTVVGVWLALEDVQEGSGELEYYVGSHRLPEFKFGGHFKHWQPERDGEAQHDAWSRALHDNAAKMGLSRQAFRPKKGSLLVWHADLAHGGMAITRPGTSRRSLVGHYCPTSVSPHFFSVDPDHAVQVPYRGGCYSSHHYLIQAEHNRETVAAQASHAHRAEPMVGRVAPVQEPGIKGGLQILAKAVVKRAERELGRFSSRLST